MNYSVTDIQFLETNIPHHSKGRDEFVCIDRNKLCRFTRKTRLPNNSYWITLEAQA